MRLKKWLLLSYFIVMILPLITAYVLFAWIYSYNNEEKVTELLQVSTKLQELKTTLDDPKLYNPNADKKTVEKLANKQVSIVLHNKDGLILYTSNPELVSGRLGVDKEALYGKLYTLDKGYRTYSYKQPVFDDNDLVGFFQVKIARQDWVSAVSMRSLLMMGIFVSLFIIIYFTVVRLVNKKLNKRLTNLMEEMTAFSRGNTLEESQTNNDEIGELQQHFYEMRRRINAAQAVIEEDQHKKEYMIAAISHDLKTPLTSIKAYAESLENEQLTAEEQNEYRKVILQKADFMKQMLDDLLIYTLLQSPSYEMELIEVDGNEFFDMLVSDYEPLCKEKQISLVSNSHVTGTYAINPKQMMRVADNLMINAIQHTAHGRNIWLIAISAERDLPNWLFSFVKSDYVWDFSNNMYLIAQNEGKGISQDKISQVFDPLYQVDQARSKKDDHGTGLGLSITKRIIEKHGGNIDILSNEKIGTCVICRIPKGKEVGESTIE